MFNMLGKIRRIKTFKKKHQLPSARDYAILDFQFGEILVVVLFKKFFDLHNTRMNNHSANWL